VERRISIGLDSPPNPQRGSQKTKLPLGGGGLYTMDFLSDLWNFIKERKKWWLMPMIVVLLLIGVLIVIGGGSAIAPFIYTLF
jgi:hypothetical protein